jgi:hypothetical protein
MQQKACLFGRAGHLMLLRTSGLAECGRDGKRALY